MHCVREEAAGESFPQMVLEPAPEPCMKMQRRSAIQTKSANQKHPCAAVAALEGFGLKQGGTAGFSVPFVA